MGADQGWVALLRGINVGGRNVVPMADLRRVFEDAGCKWVSTYIQSGNVIFTRPASGRASLASSLERAVKDAFEVPAAVVLRTFDEIGKVARSHPFGTDTSRTHVAFLAKKPKSADVRGLERLDIGPERFHVVGSEVFLLYPNGVGRARLSAALLERRLGVAGTMRNWKTVTRLSELAAATSA